MDSEQSVTLESVIEAIINIAIESWRINGTFNRMITKLDAGEQTRYTNQFRWFMKKVDESMEQAGLRVVNVEGHQFDPGMAATPLNIEEFTVDDVLIVEQMLEPIIMDKNGLARSGTVILRKVEL